MQKEVKFRATTTFVDDIDRAADELGLSRSAFLREAARQKAQRVQCNNE